jgi:hypothetical protein
MLRTSVAMPGAFLPVDVTRAARRGDRQPEPFAAAVSAATHALGTDGGWRWGFAVDVGAHYRPHTALPAPRQPLVAALTPPYPGAAGDADSPLSQVRARTGVVPFVSRPEVDDLVDWAHRSDTDAVTGADSRSPIRIAIVEGVGGSGKTRLAAEVADRLTATGWHAGFLDRNPPNDSVHGSLKLSTRCWWLSTTPKRSTQTLCST